MATIHVVTFEKKVIILFSTYTLVLSTVAVMVIQRVKIATNHLELLSRASGFIIINFIIVKPIIPLLQIKFIFKFFRFTVFRGFSSSTAVFLTRLLIYSSA